MSQLRPFVDPKTSGALLLLHRNGGHRLGRPRPADRGLDDDDRVRDHPARRSGPDRLQTRRRRSRGAEANLARSCSARPSGRGRGPRPGFWARGLAVLRDQAFWKQQAHLLLGWVIAIAARWLQPRRADGTIPLYYDAAGRPDLFGMSVDALGEALLAVPSGLALLVLGVYLLGPFARLSRWVAGRLLADGRWAVRSPAELRALPPAGADDHLPGRDHIVFGLIAIWWLTTPDGYFWPIWPLLSPRSSSAPGWIVLVLERPSPRGTRRQPRARDPDRSSVVLFGFLVGVWAVTTNGYFGRSGWRSVLAARGAQCGGRLRAARASDRGGSRRLAPARSTSRRPSCVGSSATSTTGHRLGWSRSA